MKILFQSIGVLVQYNWALPYYISRTGAKINLLTNVFPYLMGGYYYHVKAYGSVTPYFTGFGLPNTRIYDKFIATHIPIDRLATRSDIIHLNDAENPITYRLLNSDKPKIFFLHGSLDFIPSAEELKKLEEIASKVEAFAVASYHAANTVKKTLGFTPVVIHHGVDTEIFNPFNISKETARKKLSIPSDRKIILWVARISPEKNLQMAIKALPHIIREDRNILLLIKGRAVNKEYLSYILGLIKRLNVSQYVRFDLKWSPSMTTIYYYYRAADVYVHTSLTEAFGSLTLLEAMASGTPVVANNASSMPEAVGNPSLLVASEEELASKVLEILHDDKLRYKLSRECSKRVIKNFSLKVSAEKYMHLYKKMTSLRDINREVP